MIFTLERGSEMAREQFHTLTEPMYFILLALTEPMHGYDIMQTITVISNDRVTVGAGTLYALLKRFEKEGFVIQISNDGRRKTYVLAQKGREILDREYIRLKESISAYDNYLSREVPRK
jgi:DNA-binding PadR family transcriptional regulator